MAKYHLNYKGEAGLCRAKPGNCPLGETEDHFSTVEEARMAYEAAHAAFSTPAMKKTPVKAASVKKKAPVATSWRDGKTPTPNESKLIVPPQKNDPTGGYMGGRLWVGGKRPTDGSFLSQKVAAANLRKDITEAKRLGELPKDLHYGVRANTGSMVTSISAYVGMKEENGRPRELTPEEREDPNIKAVFTYVEALGQQYASEDINSMVDYFNSSNRCRVQGWHKWL